MNSQTNAQGPILLTTEDLAQLLGLEVSTLANWRWRGFGPPHVKLGGRRCRYRLRDVEEWLEQQVRDSTSDPGSRAAVAGG